MQFTIIQNILRANYAWYHSLTPEERKRCRLTPEERERCRFTLYEQIQFEKFLKNGLSPADFVPFIFPTIVGAKRVHEDISDKSDDSTDDSCYHRRKKARIEPLLQQAATGIAVQAKRKQRRVRFTFKPYVLKTIGEKRHHDEIIDKSDDSAQQTKKARIEPLLQEIVNVENNNNNNNVENIILRRDHFDDDEAFPPAPEADEVQAFANDEAFAHDVRVDHVPSPVIAAIPPQRRRSPRITAASAVSMLQPQVPLILRRSPRLALLSRVSYVGMC